MKRDLKAEARQIFTAGLGAVNPKESVKRYMLVNDNRLRVGELELNLDDFDSIWVFGAGKASAAMAQGVEEVLEDRLSGGLVITKYGYVASLEKIRLLEGGHPTPDENGRQATQMLVNQVEKLNHRDLVFLLISGGGSALLSMPVAAITLAEKMATTNLLLRSGASIQEMNAIRKHLSQVKGGQLARLAYPATLVSLILSDVVGDPLDVIASGPTVADPTTFQECVEIVDRYELRKELPEAVFSYLEEGVAGSVSETVKQGDPIFRATSTILVGTNLQALEAAAAEADRLGYACLVLSSMIEGDTAAAARFHTALAREIVNSGHPLKRPACLISGGETTVVVRGMGKGGRNQEFALEAALELEGIGGVCLLSGGTDGTDGPTEAAGAVVDGETISRALEGGLNPNKFLEENDSYHFFHHLDDLLITGPTNTNVMDLRVVLVA